LDGTFNDHHLVPKSKKGKETVRLHRLCHALIHATFSEKELAQRYNTIEALLQHEAVKTFVAWVATKPAGFHVRTRRRK
jgi:hypothetical protein